MRRRDFLTILGVALLGGAAALVRNLSSFLQPHFDAHTASSVKAVTGLMFPGGDGLPGAVELNVHDRLTALDDLHESMAYGVSWLDSWARAKGASDFLALDENERSAALDAASASEIEDARQFVVLLRYYGALNYYSEPKIKAAFAYTGPPQPDGFPDFQDPPQ